MSINHPPSVFVSSTFIDLDRERNEVCDFIKNLGMVPVLFELASFPVNPDYDAVENCLARVREKADIFVLIVGERYGSITENGKSATELEYRYAKDKGIPCYIFIKKTIKEEYTNWQKKQNGDFSKIDGFPKLFEFIKLLFDRKEKNWVFAFNSAEEIKKTLLEQLAYLFMDSLAIRTKINRSGLSEELLEDLSGASLRLAIEKPFGWEYKLFSQVLSDKISSMMDIKRDLDYGLAFGDIIHLDDPPLASKWLKLKIEELEPFAKFASVLINTALPKALGPPGEPSDIEEIVYICKQLAEVYRRILEWTIEFRRTKVIDEFDHLIELTAQMSHNVIKEIEAFPNDCSQQLDDAERRYMETGKPQSVHVTLKLTCPDLNEFDNEVRRLKKDGFMIAPQDP